MTPSEEEEKRQLEKKDVGGEGEEEIEETYEVEENGSESEEERDESKEEEEKGSSFLMASIEEMERSPNESILGPPPLPALLPPLSDIHLPSPILSPSSLPLLAPDVHLPPPIPSLPSLPPSPSGVHPSSLPPPHHHLGESASSDESGRRLVEQKGLKMFVRKRMDEKLSVMKEKNFVRCEDVLNEEKKSCELFLC